MTAASAYVHADGVSADDLGEQILLTTPAGAYLVLEGTAAAVWRLLDRARSLDDLVDACAREYEGDRDQMRRDLDEVLREWAGRGLVAAADAA